MDKPERRNVTCLVNNRRTTYEVTGQSKASVISMRFSPAFISHLSAYGKMFEALGYNVDYIAHPEYFKFAEFANCPSAISATTEGWEGSQVYVHAMVCNPAHENHFVAKRLRHRGCKVWYLYHEPAEPLLTYIRTESPSMMLKLFAAHHLSAKMLKAAHGVILSSQRAVDLYQQGDIRYNRNYFQVPLLFADECAPMAAQDRQYFSYIGNITKAHGFFDFLDVVRFSLRNNLGIHFLIASKRPLPPSIAKDDEITGACDWVRIQCGRPLSNHEINLFYSQSSCVWNLYRRSTQSGVFAKAMMCGTPVLASGAGSFHEFLTDGCEGRLLSDARPETVIPAYREISNNLRRYSANARERFNRTFNYEARLDTCRRVFGEAGSPKEAACL